MNFFYEWRKLLICIGLFLLLFALQHFTGYDFSGPLNTLIQFSMTLLGVSAIRYSVLSTSERKVLNQNLPEEESGAGAPQSGDPELPHPDDQ